MNAREPDADQVRRPARRHWLIALGVVLLAVAVLVAIFSMRSGYLQMWASRFAQDGPVGSLLELEDVEDLRSDFNEADGSPRLVLLLSPT